MYSQGCGGSSPLFGTISFEQVVQATPIAPASGALLRLGESVTDGKVILLLLRHDVFFRVTIYGACMQGHGMASQKWLSFIESSPAGCESATVSPAL
jgi:hypothetical protein